MTNENEFFVLLGDELNNYQLCILSEGDVSEIKTRQTITMATMIGRDSIMNDSVIKKFNSQSDEYYIEIVN